MPWSMKQVRYLLSKGSPLSSAEKAKMKGELHANPDLIKSAARVVKKRRKKQRD